MIKNSLAILSKTIFNKTLQISNLLYNVRDKENRFNIHERLHEFRNCREVFFPQQHAQLPNEAFMSSSNPPL